MLFGIGVYVDLYNEGKKDGTTPKDGNPYIDAVQKFFECYVSSIQKYKRVWKRMPVHFVFDQTSDRPFCAAVHAAFNKAKLEHRSFVNLAFADKKQDLPLQAADMVAYRARQLSQNFRDDKVKANWPELDDALLRPLDQVYSHNKSLFEKDEKVMMFHEALLKHLKKQRGE